MLDFDDDVTSLKWIRRRILHATENFGAHVPGNVRCAPRFLVSCNLLGPESRDFKSSLERGYLKCSALMTMECVVA